MLDAAIRDTPEVRMSMIDCTVTFRDSMTRSGENATSRRGAPRSNHRFPEADSISDSSRRKISRCDYVATLTIGSEKDRVTSLARCERSADVVSLRAEERR